MKKTLAFSIRFSDHCHCVWDEYTSRPSKRESARITAQKATVSSSDRSCCCTTLEQILVTVQRLHKSPALLQPAQKLSFSLNNNVLAVSVSQCFRSLLVFFQELCYSLSMSFSLARISSSLFNRSSSNP